MNVSVIFFLCGCYFFRVHFLYFCPSTFGQNYCCCWFPSADKRRITAVKEAARTGLENSVTEDVNRPSFKWNKINVKWMETESVPPQWLVKKKVIEFLVGMRCLSHSHHHWSFLCTKHFISSCHFISERLFSTKTTNGFSFRPISSSLQSVEIFSKFLLLVWFIMF